MGPSDRIPPTDLPDTRASHAPPAAVVALAGWLLPGLGYWLLGQRTRGVTIGVTVIVLFVMGLLIGGVRAMEVPGYNRDGEMLYVRGAGPGSPSRWIMAAAPLSEIGNKPWSITQVLTGPISIVGGIFSVWASRPDRVTGDSPGAMPTAHLNEIAVLYTAVAGMLNLLAIIDSAHRAGATSESVPAP